MSREKAVRILQATVSNDGGGLTGYICNNYRFIDKSKVQFDFLSYEEHLNFKNEFTEMGAHFYTVPHPTHFFQYLHALQVIKRENHDAAIHFNLSYANIIPIIAAKLAGFSRIIVHSHSTQIDEKRMWVRKIKQYIHLTGKQLIPYLATDYWACSKLAAEWMFPHGILNSGQVVLAHNAIDTNKFKFDREKRRQIRTELGITEDTFCVGHIGRFSYQKNQPFLVDIFYQICQKRPDSCLLLIGGKDNGEDVYQEVLDKLKDYQLENKVRLLGFRHDTSNLLQAMDAFILPSRFEGLSIVAVEVQTAGVPSFFSDAMTKETNLTSNCHFISQRVSANYWAQVILENLPGRRNDNVFEVKKAGYDLNDEVQKIISFYMQLGNKK